MNWPFKRRNRKNTQSHLFADDGIESVPFVIEQFHDFEEADREVEACRSEADRLYHKGQEDALSGTPFSRSMSAIQKEQAHSRKSVSDRLKFLIDSVEIRMKGLKELISGYNHEAKVHQVLTELKQSDDRSQRLAQRITLDEGRLKEAILEKSRAKKNRADIVRRKYRSNESVNNSGLSNGGVYGAILMLLATADAGFQFDAVSSLRDGGNVTTIIICILMAACFAVICHWLGASCHETGREAIGSKKS